MLSETGYNHTFPAVRGVQAGRPCYIAMCPMRIIPKLFKFNEEGVPPELRAQRTLNTQRIPEISSYLIDNPQDYTLSSLTASVDAMVDFKPLADTGPGQNIGTLSMPMEARILINDGQHRRAAIEEAIKENPEIGHDNISVLFFIDEELERSQQMFTDLNKNAVRPSDSLITEYDRRDPIAELARHVRDSVEIFSRLTDSEKSSISNRSTKLFTLSSIKNATKCLFRKGSKSDVSTVEKDLATVFWSEIAANMPDWQQALRKEVATYELRENYVHAHGVMLQAMGQIGADLLELPPSKWKKSLKKLKEIDWSRANTDWHGRAMVHGRISKARTNVVLTGNYIKQNIGIPLNAVEIVTEKDFKQ